ncbi:fam-a protein [Plasmodium vinckei vinckei]|uniref:Fam-a protein n=1 Tax=Plasmodium vinckei vinckei TaxID=54757 RepID=A0A449BPL0_PLAVN|nr:fam-a protein [Plasmodium vinckei vinckei]VEV55384.1 fam-a protein [Plasmodium vinckei vinckei]
MKTVFVLLSLFVYASNKTIASDLHLRRQSSGNLISILANGISDDIYKNNAHLICTDARETKQAEEMMKEAYDDIVKILWDPNGAQQFDGNFINGKFVRIYSPNLVMVQLRSRSLVGLAQEYLYALAHKVKVSENETIIVHASANINDHNDTYEYGYRNAILESANSFQTEIESEEDIRNGEIVKTYINLFGCIIKKEDDCVNLTCVNSIDVESPNMEDLILKVVKATKMAALTNLKNIVENS